MKELTAKPSKCQFGQSQTDYLRQCVRVAVPVTASRVQTASQTEGLELLPGNYGILLLLYTYFHQVLFNTYPRYISKNISY